MMGLGQGNCTAPPSWIQLSAVLVNVYKQLGLGTDLHDPFTYERIHSMGAMYVDDLDMYTWRDAITDPFELMLQAQQEVTQWSLLLNATGGALKPEKCFWYLLDYTCYDGECPTRCIRILNCLSPILTDPGAASSRKRSRHLKRLWGYMTLPQEVTKATWSIFTASSLRGLPG